MAYSPRKKVKTLYDMVKGGYEPTRKDIENEFFPEIETYKREKLARLLIKRVRNKLRKENLYFYCVGDGSEVRHGTATYKVLQSSADRLNISNKLWNTTRGFANSTNELLEDTAKNYPRLATSFLIEVKSAFALIQDLSQRVTRRLDSAIHKLSENNSESKNK